LVFMAFPRPQFRFHPKTFRFPSSSVRLENSPLPFPPIFFPLLPSFRTEFCCLRPPKMIFSCQRQLQPQTSRNLEHLPAPCALDFSKHFLLRGPLISPVCSVIRLRPYICLLQHPIKDPLTPSPAPFSFCPSHSLIPQFCDLAPLISHGQWSPQP